MPVQRIAGHVEGHILGEFHRQVGLGHRHHATAVAVDDGDRAAPIALTGDTPVTQPVIHGAFAPVQILQARDRPRLRVRHRQAVQEIRIDRHAVPGEGVLSRFDLRCEAWIVCLLLRGDHGLDRQTVFAREVHVALVVRRAGENGTGAVIHQHEIRDVDRQLPIVSKRMFCRQARGQPALFGLLDRFLAGAEALAFCNEVGDLRRGFRQPLGQRVLR